MKKSLMSSACSAVRRPPTCDDSCRRMRRKSAACTPSTRLVVTPAQATVLGPKINTLTNRNSDRVLEVLAVVDCQVCHILIAAGSADLPVASMAVGAYSIWLLCGAENTTGAVEKASIRMQIGCDRSTTQHPRLSTSPRASTNVPRNDNLRQVVHRFLLESV